MNIITAQKAKYKKEIYDRCRKSHCVTLFESAMENISEQSKSAQSFITIEGVGENVDLDGFVNIIESLGYETSPLPKEDKYLPRSIKIVW